MLYSLSNSDGVRGFFLLSIVYLFLSFALYTLYFSESSFNFFLNSFDLSVLVFAIIYISINCNVRLLYSIQKEGIMVSSLMINVLL